MKMKTIEERLNKLGITQQFYQHHKKSLTQLGFTEVQANRIIIRRSSNNTILKVVEHTPELIKYFTAEQIVQIASHDGGSKNIEAVKSSYHELKGLDFTVEQIVQIAAHGGGSKNIEAVKSSYHELKGLDFTAEQIVQIAAHGGGSKNIEAVKSSYHELKGLDFTVEQIVQIASHDGGSKNIEAVKSSYHELKGLDFTAEQIVQIAAHCGGSKNIEAVKSSYHELKGLDFTVEQIVQIAAHGGGSKNIEAVKSSYHELKGLDFTAEQIVQIASNNGGSKNIEAVKSSYHELKELDFTAEQIVQIAAHGGGSKNIEAVKSSYHELKELDFTAEQIVQIASNNGGSKNIEAVKSSYHELKGLDFTAEQIVQIASHDGGSKNIEAVKSSYQAKSPAPEPDSTSTIAPHYSSSMVHNNVQSGTDQHLVPPVQPTHALHSSLHNPVSAQQQVHNPTPIIHKPIPIYPTFSADQSRSAIPQPALDGQPNWIHLLLLAAQSLNTNNASATSSIILGQEQHTMSASTSGNSNVASSHSQAEVCHTCDDVPNIEQLSNTIAQQTQPLKRTHQEAFSLSAEHVQSNSEQQEIYNHKKFRKDIRLTQTNSTFFTPNTSTSHENTHSAKQFSNPRRM